MIICAYNKITDQQGLINSYKFMNKNEIISLIPARKLQGIKNKNTFKIKGKPLIAYTLDSIKKSNLDIKNCYILSDDERIKNIGKNMGLIQNI